MIGSSIGLSNFQLQSESMSNIQPIYHHISSDICPEEFLFMLAGCQRDYWQESFKDSIHAPKALAQRIQQGTGTASTAS